MDKMKKRTKSKPVPRWRKTKIVATLGPTSSNRAVQEAMIKAGMNVARVNFSHGDHLANGALIDSVREAATAAGRPVAVLQDLCGPKIRIGDFTTETVRLKAGKKFTLTTKSVSGTVERVSVNYRRLPKEVFAGDSILLNDGKLLLQVARTTATDIECIVRIGGVIRGRRGVNVPDASLSISAITPKDKRDLQFGLEKNVDFVTLSFVRRGKEVKQLRKLLGDKAGKIGVIAKIETREAIENLDEIISLADGIMVARGDLAIEIPREQVPIVQKNIIHKCNEAGKPVITATQMLDSMREQEVPTRAEVNDVANAVLDGSDAVMLSDETTVGSFPVLAVSAMAKIAEAAELHQESGQRRGYTKRESIYSISESVALSIAREASAIQAKAIVVFSETGRSAQLIARHRPTQPIIVATPHAHTYARLLLVAGCYPELVESVSTIDTAISVSRTVLRRLRLVKEQDVFVLSAGTTFGQQGSTNMFVVERI